MENESGKIGENLASEYLEEKGYEILERNFSVFEGEIDIIALDKKNQELVIVEVKTRKNDSFGSPEEFVNNSKINKIKKTALNYLAKNPYSDWRIDVISIITDPKTKIEHIQNITS